jgi:hypothetical protein
VLVVLSVSVPFVELLSCMSLVLVVLSISVPIVELLSCRSCVLIALSISVPVGELFSCKSRVLVALSIGVPIVELLSCKSIVVVVPLEVSAALDIAVIACCMAVVTSDVTYFWLLILDLVSVDQRIIMCINNACRYYSQIPSWRNL